MCIFCTGWTPRELICAVYVANQTGSVPPCHGDLRGTPNPPEGVVINPHVVAFPLVAQVINSYLVSLSEDALAIFISDENKDVSPDIEKTIRLLRVTEEDIRLNRIIEKGFFIDSSKSLALQLCDLCTFAARKREEQRNGFRVTPVDEKAVQLLEPLIHRGSESLDDVLAWIEQEQKKGAARD
jgi:hypothetical protein